MYSWNFYFQFGILCCFWLNFVWSNNNNPSYTLKLKRWETFKEDDNPYIEYKDMKLKKCNKTHYVMDGSFEVLRDDLSKDDLLISVLGAQRKSNGYQQSSLIQVEKRNFCEVVEKETMLMEDILKATNYSSKVCPPGKGIYSITNYYPDPDKLPNSLPIDLWRITLLNQVGDRILSGIHVYVDVAAKTLKDDY